mgnify:CR=1 FL=1
MAQAEQYAVELGIQAYLEFTRTLTPEMSVELEGTRTMRCQRHDPKQTKNA